MSKVFIWSDLHLGHKNILTFRPEFSSIEQHDNMMFANYCNKVTKRDVVWFLGDVIFDMSYLERLIKLPGDKRLVLGNHDTDRGQDVRRYFEVFNKVCSLVSYKGAWLSHAPIHPDELRGKKNYHGHTHRHIIDDERYINVCVENTNYSPMRII